MEHINYNVVSLLLACWFRLLQKITIIFMTIEYSICGGKGQSELVGQWVHHTISLMYVGARHLEFGITSHIVT